MTGNSETEVIIIDAPLPEVVTSVIAAVRGERDIAGETPHWNVNVNDAY